MSPGQGHFYTPCVHNSSAVVVYPLKCRVAFHIHEHGACRLSQTSVLSDEVTTMYSNFLTKLLLCAMI
jgi:hypothetical protein